MDLRKGRKKRSIRPGIKRLATFTGFIHHATGFLKKPGPYYEYSLQKAGMLRNVPKKTEFPKNSPYK
jgi:hypothetical protein